MSKPNRDDALETLSNQLREVQQTIKELGEAEKAIKSSIRDLLGGDRGPINAHGKTVLDVSYGRRFDPALAEELLRETDYWPQITETVIVGAKAKAILPPALYETCQRENDTPTIKPKVAKA